MNSAEFSSLVSDLDGAQAFRAETIDFTQRCLTGDENILDSELPSSPVIASFKPLKKLYRSRVLPVSRPVS